MVKPASAPRSRRWTSVLGEEEGRNIEVGAAAFGLNRLGTPRGGCGRGRRPIVGAALYSFSYVLLAAPATTPTRRPEPVQPERGRSDLDIPSFLFSED